MLNSICIVRFKIIIILNALKYLRNLLVFGLNFCYIALGQ